MWPRWVPSGLAYLSRSLLRAGHDVRVIVRREQLIKNGFDWDAADVGLRRLLNEFQPEMVGLSIMTPTMSEAGVISRLAKDICGEQTLVAAGGTHPTALPERTLAECPAIDVIVCGEAEETIVELVERGCCKDVAGIVYRNGGEIVRTSIRANPTDLDSLGPPAYELFDMDFYTEPNPWTIRWLNLSTLNIRTSRGCPNRCRFCAGHVVAGVGVRFHSMDYVMEQIRTAVDKYGVQAIHFEDDTFGADRERLLTLCDMICKEGLHKRIQWECLLRVDQAEAELLKQMKQAGCIQVEYGFESGSDTALRRLAKNATSDQNRRAVQLTRQAGLRIFADIMMGLPGETEKEFDSTLRFIRWARAEILSVTRLAPMPGTPLFDSLPQHQKDAIDWDEYSYLADPGPKFNLTAMSDERFDKRFKKFYKYVDHPQFLWSLLRDTPRENRTQRRRWLRWLVRFAIKHPIRAFRVPW